MRPISPIRPIALPSPPTPFPTLALTLTLAFTLALATGARAQPLPARAGLVVRFGDGRVLTRCVDLPEGGLTGLELLQRSGLGLTIQVQGLGALVCRIEQEGCPSADDCLCQCHSMGAGCRYWAYHSLGLEGWHYEQVGPTARRLGDGDVDGWAWGAGSISDGAAPPLMTFAQVCAAAAPTAVPSATAGPPTAAAPTVTATRRVATAAVPTATRSRAAGATVTTVPPTTGGAAPTSTVPTPGSTAPATAEALALLARRATLEAYPTALAALEATAEARVDDEAGPDGAPRPDGGGSGAAADSTPTAPPPKDRPPVADVAPPLPPSGPPAGAAGRAGRTGAGAWLTLGVLAALGLAWWRGRRADA